MIIKILTSVSSPSFLRLSPDFLVPLRNPEKTKRKGRDICTKDWFLPIPKILSINIPHNGLCLLS